MKRRVSRRRRCASHSPRRRLFEPLEPRQLLAGNLHITNVEFLDGELNPVPAPIVGEQIRLRASWTATDVTNTFRVRFLHDSLPLTSATIPAPNGAPGVAVDQST